MSDKKRKKITKGQPKRHKLKKADRLQQGQKLNQRNDKPESTLNITPKPEKYEYHQNLKVNSSVLQDRIVHVPL